MERAATTNSGSALTPGGDTSHDDLPVAQRIVVRSLVRGEVGPSGGPAMTDVVGVLEVVDEHEIVVRRKDGTIRRVARADIVVIKRVPPKTTPSSP
jgi:hypothetical protein